MSEYQPISNDEFNRRLREEPRELSDEVVQKARAFVKETRAWLRHQWLLYYLSLFGYLLGRKNHQRLFEPAYQELLADYLALQGVYKPVWARRWLAFRFTLQTVLMV